MVNSKIFRYLPLLTNILTIVAIASVLSGCDDCCCGGCDCCHGGEDGGKWYKAEVQATYENKWFIPVTPRTDWTKNWPAELGITLQTLEHPLPDGLRAVAFTSDGGVRDHNMQTHGGEIPVNSLTTEMLFYNNDTEYIIIEHPDNFAEACATTRRRNSGAYTGNSKVGSDTDSEPVRSQPDMLFRAALSEAPVDSLLREAESSAPSVTNIIEVTLRPAVYTYVVHFTFSKGLEYILNASAALSGMASGVNLSTGRTLDESCTLIFDCMKTADGLTGTVMSFGIPAYADGDELSPQRGRYGIKLQTLLTNGKRKAFTLEVTPQMAVQPLGGVIMVGDLEITEEDSTPDSGGGSFDVDVDPWGEPTDYEIIL